MKKFQKTVVEIFRDIKQNNPSPAVSIIPVVHNGTIISYLRAVTRTSVKNPEEIKRFAKWRKQSEQWFPTQFRVTLSGTKKWAKEQLIDKEDRILFMIEDLTGIAIGHVGLYRFDFDRRSCEIDNIIRGEKKLPGIMTSAIMALCQWGSDVLGIKTYSLRCNPRNTKALALYKRCGFRAYEKTH